MLGVYRKYRDLRVRVRKERFLVRGLKHAEGFTDEQEEHRRGNRPASASTKGEQCVDGG